MTISLRSRTGKKASAKHRSSKASCLASESRNPNAPLGHAAEGGLLTTLVVVPALYSVVVKEETEGEGEAAAEGS